MQQYSAEAVSLATEVALELRAWTDLQGNVTADRRGRRAVDFGAARANLTIMMGRLRKAKLLEERTPDPTPAQGIPATSTSVYSTRVAARALGSAAAGLPYQTGTVETLAAPPGNWTTAVNVNGTYPGFSGAGFICSMARVADPIDPLLPPDMNARQVQERKGRVLGQAVFDQVNTNSTPT